MAEALIQALSRNTEVAWQELPTIGETTIRHQGGSQWLPRKYNAKRKHYLGAAELIRYAIKRPYGGNVSKLLKHPECKDIASGIENGNWTEDGKQAACDKRRELIRAAADVRQAGHKRQAQEARARFNHAAHTAPAKTNRRIMNATAERKELREVYDEEGNRTADPQCVQDKLQSYLTDLSGTPWQCPKEYPFVEQRSPDGGPSDPTPDPLILEKRGNAATLADRFTRAVYDTCVQKLARNKAPGQDGILNEVIQCSPEWQQDAIYEFMRGCWDTGHLPDSLKTSK